MKNTWIAFGVMCGIIVALLLIILCLSLINVYGNNKHIKIRVKLIRFFFILIPITLFSGAMTIIFI